jgi:nucleotide-binding universal stress UspA family protein
MKPSLILHPVSYSPSGTSALAKALALTRWYQADLHILELRGRRGFSQAPTVRPFGDGGIEPRLVEFVESAGSSGARVSVVELAGDPVAAVVDYSKRASAGLVVVAANARSHGPYWRAGAYASDLARHLSCPMLMVPATRNVHTHTGGPPFTKILGDTDLSDASATVVEQASSLAHEAGAILAFVHIRENLRYEAIVPNDSKGDVPHVSTEIRRALLAGALGTSEVHTIVVTGAASRSIIDTASNNGSDLIVIGRRERGEINRVVMKSTTAQVLRAARCAVLVVPAQRAAAAPVPLESTGVAMEPAACAHR